MGRMESCKACKQQVSVEATKCPNCGQGQPTGRMTNVGVVILCLGAFVFSLMVLGAFAGGSRGSSSSSGYGSAYGDVFSMSQIGRNQRYSFCHVKYLGIASREDRGVAVHGYATNSSGVVVDDSMRFEQHVQPGEQREIEFSFEASCNEIVSVRIVQE